MYYDSVKNIKLDILIHIHEHQNFLINIQLFLKYLDLLNFMIKLKVFI